MADNRPVDWEELYPGKFIKAADLKGQQRTLTIASIVTEDLESDDGGTRLRGIIAFKEHAKSLVLNRTNGVCIREMLGRKVQEWVGKRVTLYPTTSRFGRETVPAIRVWGSPDIHSDMTVEVKLPRRRAQQMTMKATGASDKPTNSPEFVKLLAQIEAANSDDDLTAVGAAIGKAKRQVTPAEFKKLGDAGRKRRDELSATAPVDPVTAAYTDESMREPGEEG